MPPILTSVISIIQLAANAGPVASKIYQEGRALIDMLFNGGIITIDQQKATKDWADAHEAAVLAGEVPPAFQVEPD